MSRKIGEDAHIELVVQKNFNEVRRLDQYVVSRLPELSRGEVQRLIDEIQLTLNGKKAKASHKVRQGDLIVIDLPGELIGKPEPQEIPLEILYEDEFLVVLNKQANLIVHPGRGKENWSGTLTNALQFHFEKLSTYGGMFRPGIVHRLDRDTTGLLVVAKDDLAHRNLAMQFEQRKVHKEYVAICYGNVDRDSDYIEKRIGPHPSVREKMAIREDPAIGRTANTFYQVEERFNGYTFVRLKPTTGRTHQLRVHLSSIGFPMLADKPYSGRHEVRLAELTGEEASEESPILINRQALHAVRLRFRHPRCQEIMDMETPLPADFERTLAALREHRPLGGGET